MTVETKARAEYVLFNGSTSRTLATEYTSASIDTEGLDNFAIFLLSQQAGVWAIDGKVNGQWLPLGTGAYAAATPIMIAMEEELPPTVRLRITQTVTGHIMASLRPVPSRWESYDTTEQSTLAWVTALGALPTITFVAIGPTGALTNVRVMDGNGATLADVAVASAVAESDYALAVQAPVLGVSTGAAVITDAVGYVQQYLRGLVKLTAENVVATLGAAADAKVDTDVVGTLSAKLRGVVSRLVELNTVAGTTAGAAVITDAAGALQQYLRGLVKLTAENLVATLGATTGAAVVTDVAGTVQQYLRGLVKIYADIWNSSLHLVRVGVTQNLVPNYYTGVARQGGAETYVTTVAGGGNGSDYWNLAQDVPYELRCDPDWTNVIGGGAAADSDMVRGVLKIHASTAPTGDLDGWFIRTGERAQITVTGATRLYVRAHNLGIGGVWSLRRMDA